MNVVSDFRHLTIASATGPYSIEIGPGQLARALTAGPDVVIADRFFVHQLRDVAPDRLLFVDADESQKTLTTVERLISEMRGAGLRRDGSVLAIGGGVVQDVVTLAAQLYMRGVSWSLVPTTLMSMADSCVGGKSSINVGNAKNLVGGIYPPSAIHIDPLFVDSLSAADRACGYLEAVKIAYCRGAEPFGRFMDIVGDQSHDGLTEVLSVTLEAKRWFIEVDEFDRAERRILNFGHTFGHALEAGSHFAVKHGIAVGIGMLAALRFAADERDLLDHERRLGSYVVDCLAGVVDFAGLPDAIDWPAFRAGFDSDKKHRSDGYVLILPSDGPLGAELTVFDRSAHTVDRVESSLVRALQEAS